MTGAASRRSVLVAGLGVAATAATGAAPIATAAVARGRETTDPTTRTSPRTAPTVDYHAWTSHADWLRGSAHGTRPVGGPRPGVSISRPVGTADYTDPHTGETRGWEYASWTSPRHRLPHPATELIVSWNAHTPAGTWITVEAHAEYTDGTGTPWYVMGRWAAGDEDIKRTSVDGQSDGRSSVWTDTLTIDEPSAGARVTAYRLRVTLHRAPGGPAPTVWRLGAMGSDIPERFTVPASTPGGASGIELRVPRYSQNIHVGQYPEYDNGGEAWCSPTSSQMIIEYWGRHPSRRDLAWVNPSYDDPQVCHAARQTYDYQYGGCGNWPFNAAYAATYPDMQGVVSRLRSLDDLEALIRVGIPVITSQSFRAEELTGAGYGTSGHLMTVIGFTADGDVIANDPASDSDRQVRRVYQRREWENIWLRTRRHDAEGEVKSGSGGVCYVYFPARPAPGQRAVLGELGIV